MTGLEVKIWMMGNRIKATQVAKSNKCSDSMVSQFLKGDKTSQKLVDYLINKGCPKGYFKNGKVDA